MPGALFPPADSASQWFAPAYPGAAITPRLLVVHTTETSSWPSYAAGAKAPHLTARPDFIGRRLSWRQHYPLDRSSRALRNEAGGVDTNTAGAVQVELIGTCDPTYRTSWTLGSRTLAAGRDYVFWPESPEWALAGLAELVAWLHREWGIPLSAPAVWLPYPGSYGSSRARLSHDAWRQFRGVLGHQHVPENTHGDPGALDITRVLQLAAPTPTPATPRKGIDMVKLIRVRGTKAVYKCVNYSTIEWIQSYPDFLALQADMRGEGIDPEVHEVDNLQIYGAIVGPVPPPE